MSTLPFQLLVATLAGWVNRNQQDVIEYLQEENRVLREQVGDRRDRLGGPGTAARCGLRPHPVLRENAITADFCRQWIGDPTASGRQALVTRGLAMTRGLESCLWWVPGEVVPDREVEGRTVVGT